MLVYLHIIGTSSYHYTLADGLNTTNLTNRSFYFQEFRVVDEQLPSNSDYMTIDDHTSGRTAVAFPEGRVFDRTTVPRINEHLDWYAGTFVELAVGGEEMVLVGSVYLLPSVPTHIATEFYQRLKMIFETDPRVFIAGDLNSDADNKTTANDKVWQDFREALWKALSDIWILGKGPSRPGGKRTPDYFLVKEEGKEYPDARVELITPDGMEIKDHYPVSLTMSGVERVAPGNFPLNHVTSLEGGLPGRQIVVLVS